MRELRKKEKGVSEVIGTILILAITVVLFSSIFYYVAVMPPPKSQVYSSFSSSYQINTNGTFNVTIVNNGGESLSVYFTELEIFIQNPNEHIIHTLSYSKIYNQIKGDYFKVGDSFYYNSSWDNVSKVTYLSTISIYLIDTQNNQVVWSNVLQGSVQGIKVIGFSYSPQPFIANITFTGHIISYVIYNSQNKILPKVGISIPRMNIKNQFMGFISPMEFEYTNIFSQILAGNYNVYINATLGNISNSYIGIIQVINTSASNIALRIVSLTLNNIEPTHGSNNLIFLSIYNPSNNTEKFRLNITDYYSGYNNGWNYINSSVGDPTSYFTITPMTSLPITINWFNVGGNVPAEGNHILKITFSNVTPYIPNIGNSIKFTVLPKILLVDDENVPTTSSLSVFNNYYSMFQYLNYPVDVQYLTSTNNVASIGGYDLIVWITGNSSTGIGYNNRNNLNTFIDTGGSLLMEGTHSSTFSEFFINTNQNIIYANQNKFLSNTTIKYQNLTSISPNSNNIQINYMANITYNPYINSYVTFTISNNEKYLANITNSASSVVYGTTGNSGKYGKFIFIGYEFSNMYIYQQDYIMNKMVMWLSNITIRSGLDIALADMKVSNYNPMFMQPINFTFYIQNLSPGSFNSTTLYLTLNNQIVNVFQNGTEEPSSGITVPAILKGNGAMIAINVEWYANVPPGSYKIFAYVNPNHNPQEINYNNNGLSSLININLNVKFSILVLYAHQNKNGNKNNITSVTNALNNTIGANSYKFINYLESSSIKNYINLNNIFPYYNLVIVDFNNTGYLNTNLSSAMVNYLTNPNTSKYPYSLIIIGENVSTISKNQTLMNILSINSFITSNNNSLGNLIGLTYNQLNLKLGPMGANVSRGYGLIYQYSGTSTLIKLNKISNGTVIFNSTYSGPVYSSVKVGNAIIENVSNVIVTIFPYDFENILGFIQNHTQAYSPSHTSSNPLYSALPSSEQYAKNFLMMNFLIASRYLFNNPLPEILSPDISINSPMVTLNNYYLFSVTMRNLGAVPIYVTLEAFEETSMYYSSQPIYLVGSTSNTITTVTATIIWKPSYAASPIPEWLRFVLVPASANIPISPMQEALISKQVYYFYDNGSTLSGWEHYNVLAYITGENLFGLNNPNTNIASNWTQTANGGDINIKYGITSKSYFSYPYSTWIQDIIDNYNKIGNFGYVYLSLPSVTVYAGSIVTLSWYWKYSIAEAQNGIFLMVDISKQGSTQWYQVYLPYNSNPDLGNVVQVKDPYHNLYAKIYQAFNGVSGGGTFSWEFYSINSNNLYVMNPTTGLPMPNPLNVTGESITFVFYYIAPDINANSSSGSSTPGNGTYIDNVLLSISNGGNDGWRIITPNQKSTYYGIANDGIGKLGFQGSPTANLIADYNNNSGYPSFDDSLWDNLVTPPIDLVNSLTASLNFTFKANIAQGLYGYGWPGDMFILSISNNNGASWTQIYSPPTYPTNPILPSYKNSGQSGGGTVYYNGSGFAPANNANSTFWLTVSIPLNFFVGQNILLDFQIVTNDGWGSGSYLFTPWHAVGYKAASSNPFLGFYMTNVYIQGYSFYTPIQVQSVWS